jgi:hypothetical protein
MDTIFRMRGEAALPWMALVALIAGFTDLAQGGITAAPILLVIAFCGLIPAAILRTGRRAATAVPSAPSGWKPRMPRPLSPRCWSSPSIA